MAKQDAALLRFLSPVLEALHALGGSARTSEVRASVAKRLNLSEDEQSALLPSGKQTRFANQVAWARVYLGEAGLVESSERGIWSLTEHGQKTTHLSKPEALQVLKSVRSRSRVSNSEVEAQEPQTSHRVETTYRDDLLNLLKNLPPAGFERLCKRLLRESGFEQVEVTGRSGDGGIDGHGVLQINPLVSFRVLFQCKRYAGSVGPSTIRDFRGAMQGRTDKGIILTTGTFTTDAQKEALRDGASPIELVDGEKLVNMFEHLELGLKPRTTYDIDEGFFIAFRS